MDSEKLNRIKKLFEEMKPFGDSIFKVPQIPIFDKEDSKLYEDIVVKNLIRCGAIPKSELEVGSWYLGRYRNAQYGRWNGKVFEHEKMECGFWFKETKQGNHFEDDNGYALFVPIKKIDKPENLNLDWDD